VVEPCCDLGSVHRFLRHHRAPGVHKVSLLLLLLLVPSRCPVARQCRSMQLKARPSEPLFICLADANAHANAHSLGSGN
jgi:hypothetical protein